MFGFLYGAFYLFANGVAKVSREFESNQRREEAKLSKEITYYDRAQLRWTETGEKVWRAINSSNGHDVIRGMFNGRIYHDYTEEYKDKLIEEAKSKGKTIALYTESCFPYTEIKNTLWRKMGIYPRGVDIFTRKPIVDVWISRVRFYMDADTGLLLRKADGEQCPDDKAEYMIKLFNERQNRIKADPKFMEDRFWTRHEFFLESRGRERRAFISSKGIIVWKP